MQKSYLQRREAAPFTRRLSLGAFHSALFTGRLSLAQSEVRGIAARREKDQLVRRPADPTLTSAASTILFATSGFDPKC